MLSLLGRSIVGSVCVAGVLAVTGLVSHTMPVDAQDTRLLLNRIERLERELTDLQRQAYGAGGAPSSAVQATSPAAVSPDGYAARAEIRLQRLETEIRRLTGRFEELDHSVRQIAGQLDKLIGDVDYRLRVLEQGTAPDGPVIVGGRAAATGTLVPPNAPASGAPVPATPAAGAAPPGAEPPRVLGQLTQSEVDSLSSRPPAQATTSAQTAGAAPTTQSTAVAAGPVLPAGPAVEQYKFAFDRLMKRDYPIAQAAFEEFLAAHPEDPLSGNAAYWLGETHYVRGNFADAAVAFANGYQNYPGSSKTADNLLKLALSLRRLDRTQDACLALARLRDEFPNASRSIKRRAESEAQLMQCAG